MNTPGSALVLDFGGVISRTLFETHELTERELGLPSGSLTWLGPFAPETDLLWQKMQNDDISEREYWLSRTKEMGALVGESWGSMETFVQRARGNAPSEVIRPEFLEVIDRAKSAGKRLAILSNELDLFYGEKFRSQLPFMKQFDLVVDATYSKILKPDLRAYEAITEGLNLQASACVFVDDQLRNIHGAKQAGMQTVHFDVQNPLASYNDALSKLGITI